MNRYLLAAVSVVVTLALGAGFLVADKEWLHWYAGSQAHGLPQVAAAATSDEPDRVVGVTWTCWEYTADTSGKSSTGAICEYFYDQRYQTAIRNGTLSSDALRISNVRANLTVRTAQGTVYDTAVDHPPVDIHLGDPWPPK